MEKTIRKVLNAIEKSGFEAYIVGGYVRDLLVGRTTWDIDICTNAVPKELVLIFPNANVGIYGAVDFKIGKYSFEITTYRKEYNYKDRHPSQVKYISNLLEDLNRRDFTINAICMNQKGNIIDPLNAREDLKKRQIRIVGNAEERIVEDPLRILRAIRFATCLNFDLDLDLTKEIKKHYLLVATLSDYRIIEELSKILINKNYLRGLQLLSDLGILQALDITYTNIVKTSDISGMWAQLNMVKKLAFNKETLHNINTIRKIVDRAKIDCDELFEFGLYYCIIAGEIIGISKKNISNIYKKMPIKKMKDIAVSTNGIISYLSIEPDDRLGIVLDDLKSQILHGVIRNTPRSIFRYLNQTYKGDNTCEK